MDNLSVNYCPHRGGDLTANDNLGYFAVVGRLVHCSDCEVDWHIIQEEEDGTKSES
jgi:hypothetical protein